MKAGRTLDQALAGMREAAAKAVAFVDGAPCEAFVADEKTVYAVLFALAVVGEAAKQVPAAFREQHQYVLFKLAAGMRDKVIHEYFGVRRERLWQTCRRDLPELIAGLDRIATGRGGGVQP